MAPTIPHIAMSIELHWLRLLQLSSSSLPVGGFSFSQGLEWAVEAEWVVDEASCLQWLESSMQQGLVYSDLALLQRLIQAVEADDKTAIAHWDAWVLACRDTAELRQAERMMGHAMCRVLANLFPQCVDPVQSYVAGFALAAQAWQLPMAAALAGYAWSWLDGQVAAAAKLIPLGQQSIQRVLATLGAQIPDCVREAQQVADDDLGRSLPQIALASSWHEQQHTRLFRS